MNCSLISAFFLLKTPIVLLKYITHTLQYTSNGTNCLYKLCEPLAQVAQLKRLQA